ncbi:MAG: hypothetical protein M9938_01950 [Solirubrobacterales bacterium]|nr:hypothetical protein [Solirubrobacterales bacterium]
MPQSEAARRWGTPLLFVVATSAVLLLLFPTGFPNYDTIYYLLWGKEIALGQAPDYAPPLVPTPHPLYDLLGIVTTPLGDGAITVTVILAYVSLGLLAWVVFELGRHFFDLWVGLIATVLVMTAAPVLSNGIRAYIDIPFLVLCLAALLIEARKPRAGWPVLALLIPAGLLRPEAWLFSGVYLLWICFEFPPRTGSRIPGIRLRDGLGGSEAGGLLLLAIAAPVAWLTFDLITAGNALQSFTGTRSNVETLERDTGPIDVFLYGPRRLGEVLQWPGMIGALAGIVLVMARMPRRGALLLVAALLAGLAFALLGAAGLAIIARYTLLGASVLAIFVAAALLGWRLLPGGDPWRRGWIGTAVVVVLLYLAWLPNQIDLLRTVDRDLSSQSLVERDLEALVNKGAFEPRSDIVSSETGLPLREPVESCLPISVPNHRAVPRLAFWLDIRPSRVVSIAATGKQPEEGFFLAPARSFTLHNFILDPGEPGRAVTKPPPGFRKVARNRSWVLYSNCRADRP